MAGQGSLQQPTESVTESTDAANEIFNLNLHVLELAEKMVVLVS